MRVVFLGGPWHDRVREIPDGTHHWEVPVRVTVGSFSRWDAVDDGGEGERVDRFMYRLMHAFSRTLMTRLDSVSWPVMVPEIADDREIQELLDWDAKPVVTGPRNPFEFDEIWTAAAYAMEGDDR